MTYSYRIPVRIWNKHWIPSQAHWIPSRAKCMTSLTYSKAHCITSQADCIESQADRIQSQHIACHCRFIPWYQEHIANCSRSYADSSDLCSIQLTQIHFYHSSHLQINFFHACAVHRCIKLAFLVRIYHQVRFRCHCGDSSLQVL